MSRGARGALAGGIAGTVMVALMLRGTFTAGFPVVALALWERALRLMPMEVFGFLIVRLKFLAKPVAFWGMLGAVILAFAALGYLVGRAPWMRRTTRAAGGSGAGSRLSPGGSRGAGAGVVAVGAAGTFVLAFLLAFVPLVGLAFTSGMEYLRGRLEGLGVINPEPAAVAGQVLAALAVYAAIFAVAVTALTVWPARGRGGSSAAADEAGRRELLRRSLAVGVGLLAGSALGRWVGAGGRQAAAFAQDVFSQVRGLPPEVTPNDQFYVVSKNPPGFDPVLKEAQWQLEVRTQPDNPLVLRLADIKAMPSVRRPHTLECISNEIGGDLISNAHWRGVRLRDVIAKAGGVPAKAIKIVFRCADGYTESLPIAEAMHEDTLLVYEMNGSPLPTKHGFPVRLLVPGLFGMKNPKWITKIESADFDFQGYWERSGWSDRAVVQTMSKFTAPPRQPRPRAGEEVGLGGVAYAGSRGIKSVEYSVDDGKTWMPAQTKPPLGPYTWVLWAALWKPTGPGEYRLKVRARDGAGALQIATPAPTLPDGATGYHTIRVRVEK